MIALYRIMVGALWLCRTLTIVMMGFCWWMLLDSRSVAWALVWCAFLGTNAYAFCVWWVRMSVYRPRSLG